MNKSGFASPSLFNIVGFLILFTTCITVAFVLATQNIYWVTGAVLGTGIFAIGFLNPGISLYFLIFSMLLSPEFGSRDVSGEGFTIRFEDLLLIVMGFAWLAKSAINKDIGLAAYSRLNRPILYYILACTFATAWGVISGTVKSPITGFFFVLKYIEYFVVFFLTLNIVSTKTQLKKLLGALFITYIIVVIIGFSQIPRGIRITAPFEGEGGEPNSLGGYLLIMLSLNVVLFLNVKRLYHKIALATLATMCFVAILYTLSRATWLGMVVMYITLIIFCKKKKILIFALVLGTIFAPFTMPKTVIDRIYYTFTKEKGAQIITEQEAEYLYKVYHVRYDTSTLARLGSMNLALKDFLKKPLLGFGVTGYQFLDAQFHRVLVETGLLGFSTFIYLLWMTGSSLFKNMKKYHEDTLYYTLSMGTFCAFIGLLGHAVGTNTFVIVRIMEPLWCLTALNLAIPIIEGDIEDIKKKIT